MSEPDEAPRFLSLIDLASDRNGGRVLSASDDFFAEKENLVRDEEPVFKPGVFTERGKWMDGWESRRRRSPGHDWCVVALGYRGVVRGVDVDTRHFSGNEPEHATVDAFDAHGDVAPPDGADAMDDRKDGRSEGAPNAEAGVPGWTRILGPVALGPSSRHFFAVDHPAPCTHLRLNIYPDGGVARLRAYGEVVPDFSSLGSGEIELSSHRLGGRALACSDEHFGRMQHLLQPGPPENMGDGWETRRRRGPGFDWVVVALGCPGLVEALQIETTHFKGNYPGSCRVEACSFPYDAGSSFAKIDGAQGDTTGTPDASARWVELVGEQPLSADAVLRFKPRATGPFTHVRLSIYPDGGVARLRVFGRPAV